MGSAGLYNALIAGLEIPEAGNQCVERGQKFIFQSEDRRNVHRGREGVVRALGLVAVIVRVQQLFARNFVAAVCNDLVHVHVGLGAAAGLPDREREVAL